MAGCTSDQNCASNQSCENVDSLSHVGTCQNHATKDCAAFFTKCNACGGGAMCTQQVCDALSAECVSCVASVNCDDSGSCPCN
jgi:hypothetical protein